MNDIDSILERIRSGLGKHGRKTKVSQDTGISTVALSRARDPNWNPTANQIRVLDASIAKLFPAPPEPPHPHD